MHLESFLLGLGSGIVLAIIVFLQVYVNLRRDVTREQERLKDARKQLMDFWAARNTKNKERWTG